MDENRKCPAVTLRRKDYITYLAVGLFVFVIAFEVLLVTWLPRRLHSMILWQDQVACEEMIELEDLLRAYLIGAKPKFRSISGEIDLMQSCLNEFAAYLREYKDYLSREQIDQIYYYLKNFEHIYAAKVKHGKSFIKIETLDPFQFIENLRKSSEIQGRGSVKPPPP